MLELFHQEVEAQNHLCMTKSSEAHKSQLRSQLWIWRWEVIRDTSFMFKQVSFDISNTHIEEFEVKSKISQNRK